MPKFYMRKGGHTVNVDVSNDYYLSLEARAVVLNMPLSTVYKSDLSLVNIMKEGGVWPEKQKPKPKS